MIDKKISPATALVKTAAAVNVLGNIFGVMIVLIYFVLFQPGVTLESATEHLPAKALIVLVVWISAVVVIAPINMRWIFPLTREVRRTVKPLSEGSAPDVGTDELRNLVGKLLKLPAKLAVTTLVGWLIAATAFFVLSWVVPSELYPWPSGKAGKVSASMVLVAAPLTAGWIFFFHERWMRKHIRKFFPTRALLTSPSTFRINVLPKMLIVSLLITTLPLAMVGQVTLHEIHEIRTGNLQVESFISYMPTVIWFLLVVFTVAAVALSIFVARSISEPLKAFESAMQTFRKGDLDASVPVLSNDEIGRTGEGFNSMVHEHRVLDSVRDTFGRYLSTEVVNEILKSPGGVELKGELREITILVSDIRGFTRTTESLRPEQVLEMLNRYLEVMTDIIMKYGGTIDEFTGDGILVFFGAPTFFSDHCTRAVRCALEMQEAMDKVNRGNLVLGLPEMHTGIGINTGRLIIGNIGSEKRKKYGAVGSPINLAFRAQSEAASGEVLVTPAVFNQIAEKLLVKSSKEYSLKGIEQPVVLYNLKEIRLQS